MLYQLIQRLDVGYAVRATSYAGHGIGKHKVLGLVDDVKEEEVVENDEKRTVQSSSNLLSYKRKDKKDVAHTIDAQVEHKI